MEPAPGGPPPAMSGDRLPPRPAPPHRRLAQVAPPPPPPRRRPPSDARFLHGNYLPLRELNRPVRRENRSVRHLQNLEVDRNLRADTSFAGYDGLKVQRANQSILFLNEFDCANTNNIDIPHGSLLILNHDEERYYDVFENAGNPLSDTDLSILCNQTKVYRPGMDVTKAELVGRTNWRRQEKKESVGNWKARVYEMHNVTFTFRSRKVNAVLAVGDRRRFRRGFHRGGESTIQRLQRQAAAAQQLREGGSGVRDGVPEERGYNSDRLQEGRRDLSRRR
ncbi:hypothetical protein ABFS83_07G086800 [Erythranthe nasuta]